MTEGEAEYIEIKADGVDELLDVIRFRVKQTARMKHLKESYSEKVGIPVHSLRFLFEGRFISDDDTARMLEINQGDTIDVFLEKGNLDENGLLRMVTSNQKRKLEELEEENVDIRSKNALLLTAKEEACKQRRLLEDTLKCPVCLQLPKELPVLCCPNGHIVCSPCNEQMKKRGNLNCSTCKVPMEGGRSLVAQSLIENMDHTCGFNGCGKMVHFKEYKDHQRSCDRRPVCCPGHPCDVVLPFQEINHHVLNCRTMKMVDSGLMFTVEDEVGRLDDDGSWKTRIIRGTLNTEDDEKNWKLFFFRMEKKGDFYHIEVVMLGSEEECNKLTVVVSILDKEGVKEVVGFFCNPRPINEDSSASATPHCLLSAETLMPLWSHNEEGNATLKVRVFIREM